MPWLEELQGARPGVESNLRFLERRERAECGSELRGITALLAGPTPPGRDGLLLRSAQSSMPVTASSGGGRLTCENAGR